MNARDPSRDTETRETRTTSLHHYQGRSQRRNPNFPRSCERDNFAQFSSSTLLASRLGIPPRTGRTAHSVRAHRPVETSHRRCACLCQGRTTLARPEREKDCCAACQDDHVSGLARSSDVIKNPVSRRGKSFISGPIGNQRRQLRTDLRTARSPRSSPTHTQRTRRNECENESIPLTRRHRLGISSVIRFIPSNCTNLNSSIVVQNIQKSRKDRRKGSETSEAHSFPLVQLKVFSPSIYVVLMAKLNLHL
ncbi:hypothetical protein B0H66DRAFT_234615 [Apodospora peruviana]|uniref:Uncharacterized protein n=1 Tax=Apodospora peruviana TaxID=516989 RepID=A0AAE0I4W7_9PEZI|nr:hypothetical protein B0H66DRAFT_234615 [Apodospora peruviana]